MKIKGIFATRPASVQLFVFLLFLSAGALLAFLYSFDEVALSSLLSTPRFVTLPIRIMNYMEMSFDPTLAAISTLLILCSLILMLLMEKFVGLDMFMR